MSRIFKEPPRQHSSYLAPNPGDIAGLTALFEKERTSLKLREVHSINANDLEKKTEANIFRELKDPEAKATIFSYCGSRAWSSIQTTVVAYWVATENIKAGISLSEAIRMKTAFVASRHLSSMKEFLPEKSLAIIKNYMVVYAKQELKSESEEQANIITQSIELFLSNSGKDFWFGEKEVSDEHKGVIRFIQKNEPLELFAFAQSDSLTGVLSIRRNHYMQKKFAQEKSAFSHNTATEDAKESGFDVAANRLKSMFSYEYRY